MLIWIVALGIRCTSPIPARRARQEPVRASTAARTRGIWPIATVLAMPRTNDVVGVFARSRVAFDFDRFRSTTFAAIVRFNDSPPVLDSLLVGWSVRGFRRMARTKGRSRTSRDSIGGTATAGGPARPTLAARSAPERIHDVEIGRRAYEFSTAPNDDISIPQCCACASDRSSRAPPVSVHFHFERSFLAGSAGPAKPPVIALPTRGSASGLRKLPLTIASSAADGTPNPRVSHRSPDGSGHVP